MDERYNRIVRNEEFNRLLDEIEALEADRIYCRHGLEHLLDVARISYIQVLEDGLDYDKNVLLCRRAPPRYRKGRRVPRRRFPAMRPVRPLRKEFFETADMRNRKFR